MKVNNTALPNTNITLKEFKELLYNKFKAYPLMFTDYKNNTFIIQFLKILMDILMTIKY